MSELPATADVVIIGGGFAGAATAWALGHRGIDRVIVLEREDIAGRFASGRSAGLGRQLADDDDTTALTVRGAALLRDLPAAWSPTGGMLTFDDPATADAYTARAARFGVAIEPVAREHVLARWPHLADLRVTRALWVPSDGTIEITALLRSLLGGVRLALGAGVIAIEPGPRVVTARGAIRAKVVVDASGAWGGTLVGGEPLAAYKRHVFVLQERAEAGAPWLWHLGRSELYVRADAGGVLVSPCDAARSEPGHQEPDLVGEAQLRKLLDDAAPQLASAPITRRWACQRTFTEDRKMRLGRDDDRPWLVWALGLGGHGATASAAVGQRVAAAVIDALTD